MDNPLAIAVRNESIDESEGLVLQNNFVTFLQQIESMKQQALSINVTSVDQIDEIKKAREWRLTVKNIRVDCEKVRKKLKEDSLRRGRAIDGMANVIKDIIAPIEEHLDNQEKFVELQEMKRIAEVRQKRILELLEYQVDGNNFQGLGEMPEEQYTHLLNGVKDAFEKALEAAKKADEDRIKREQEEAAERERLKAENAKLLKKQEEESRARREEEAKRAKEREAERVKNEKLKQKLKEEEDARIEAERKLKETKKVIREEKKAEKEAPRARAYAAGELQLDGEDIPKSAKAGDLVIFLKDTPENRFAMAHLMRP